MDQDKVQMFSYLVFTKLEGAVTSGMIHLGDKLGLYRAMKDAAAPLHSGELAELTGQLQVRGLVAVRAGRKPDAPPAALAPRRCGPPAPIF